MTISALERGTSAVDWCESNYAFNPFIAEYVNTWSNFLFVLLPPLLIRLFDQYARAVNRGIYLIWALFAAVGFASAYFHATLSLLGQLLDELSILWLLAAAFGMWLPRRCYPSWLKNDREAFKRVVFALSVVGTLLAWAFPWLNAFVLMALGAPCFALLYFELKSCTNKRIKRLGVRCALAWISAVFCWVSDRFFCDLWSSLDFPYLHGAWHVLIAITSYTICVLFAFFDANNEHIDRLPTLKYWPVDSFELGVPYIVLKNLSHQ